MTSIDRSSEQISQLTQKRLALESLISITCSVQIQQQSLLELSAIARPSQEFPEKLINYIQTLKQRIGGLSASEIIQRLDAIENVMAKGMDHILQLVEINVSDLRDEQLDAISIDEFIDAIGNFHRRTQTAVALRYLLIEQGVAIAPFSLSVPQETIGLHIEQLRSKENDCRAQIRTEIKAIIADSKSMLEDEAFSEAMKEQIIKVNQAMQVNLEHLDAGGKVKDIPNVFETIVLESEIVETVEPTIPIAEKQDASSNATLENKNIPPAEPLTFIQKLNLWLSSPWRVSWKTITTKSKQPSEKAK
jgi:hypothetical protein